MTPGSRRPRAQPDSEPKRWPVKRAESFGGVAVRKQEGGQFEVVMIRTQNLKGKTVWTLPKGTPEADESPEQTALREVREETGIEVELVERIEDITYWFVSAAEGLRYKKTVHFYLMRVIGGDPSQHDHEVEEVQFVSLDEAPRLATYPTDRKVLQRAAELVRAW